MALGKAAIKVWRDTRPSELKDTGVAGALEDWDKNCSDPATLSAKQIEAALKTSTDMLEVIITAGGKLAQLKTAKKDDKKIQKAIGDTETLLASWKKEALKYQADVQEATEALILAKATELSLEGIKDAFEKLEGNLNQLKVVAKAALANKPVDIDAGFKEVAKSTFTIKNTTKFFTSKGLLDQIDRAERELSLKSKVKGAKVPAKITVLKTQLTKYETDIGNIAGLLDDAADKLQEEPEFEGGDEEYGEALKNLQKEYKVNLAAMKKAEANGKNLLKMAEKFGAAAKGPLANDPEMAKKIEEGRSGILKKATDLEEELRALAEEYRERNGKLFKMRQFVDPPEEDVKKYLAPFVTRLNDANLRGTRVVGRIREAFAED